MEDFTWGWCPVLTEDLPAAVSDMEWSVNGWRAVSIKRYACEVQRQGWDKMQDNLRALKSRLINVWFIAVRVSTCVCQRHRAPFQPTLFFLLFHWGPVHQVTFLCCMCTVFTHVCLLVCTVDVWGGMHGDGLGLELMCSSTCEMRTRGKGTGGGGPHHTHIRLPADITWHFSMIWWQTHKQTHTSLPSTFSPLSFFSSSKKARHKTDLTDAQFIDSLEVQDTFDHTVRKGGHGWGEQTHKKNQAQPIPLLGYFQSASKKQYSITAVPFTVTWLTSSYLFFVLSLLQVKHFVL